MRISSILILLLLIAGSAKAQFTRFAAGGISLFSSNGITRFSQNLSYQDITNGIVGWWQFNDGSGTTATASSPSTFGNMTMSASSWTTGKDGTGAYNFTGTQYGSIAAAQRPQSGFTVCGWMNVANVTPTQAIACQYDSVSPANSYLQFYLSGGAVTARMMQNATTYIGRASSATLTTGWHHVGMTWSGGTTAVSIAIYIDGVAVDNANDNAGSFTAVASASTGVFYFGVLDNSHILPITAPFDDWRMYNRGLSSAEMLQLATNPAK